MENDSVADPAIDPDPEKAVIYIILSGSDTGPTSGWKERTGSSQERIGIVAN